MSDKYILDGKKPVRCDDVLKWSDWFEKAGASRQVAATLIGDMRISTVFLGLNHRFGDGPPQLFETMVFEGPLDGEMERYSTWEQAEAGHAAMVAKVEAL